LSQSSRNKLFGFTQVETYKPRTYKLTCYAGATPTGTTYSHMLQALRPKTYTVIIVTTGDYYV